MIIHKTWLFKLLLGKPTIKVSTSFNEVAQNVGNKADTEITAITTKLQDFKTCIANIEAEFTPDMRDMNKAQILSAAYSKLSDAKTAVDNQITPATKQ